MITVLAIIYIVFISLGLPDSLFGVAWPVAHVDFGSPESLASLYSIITGICSGLSSFFSGRLIRRFGTPAVTFISIVLTIIGIMGMSFAPVFPVMMAFAMIMGFGAGAIDTGLNNYVSLHYKASHMNWLHAFWGVGVTVSPLIMSLFLGENGSGWRNGYRTIALIQGLIALIVLVALKKWKSLESSFSVQKEAEKSKTAKPPVKGKNGLIVSILSMGCYTAMEFIIMTFGATFFVNVFSVDAATASRWVSFYFGGIMAGRMASGFLSMRVSDNNLIRFGIGLSFVGMLILILRLSFSPFVGFLLIGLGFAPVFPCIVHLVPRRFGEEFSADYTGYTMGGGYAVGYLSSLIFGFAAGHAGFALMPVVLMIFAVLVLVCNETTNVKTEI